MPFPKGRNDNHPKAGSAIKVDPIRDLNAVARIKRMLIEQHRPRDYCLFTVGINTAWRANELLSLTVGDVRGLKAWDALSLKQSKNGKYRTTIINPTVVSALEFWLCVYDSDLPIDAPLFPSQREGALTVPTLCNMVKGWCSQVELPGKYASHTLRKTWGFMQRVQFNTPLSLLVKAYGHASERQTLEYLGIQPQEIFDLYRHEI